MGIVYQNELKKGLIYNGKNYYSKTTPYISSIISFSMKKSVTPSLNAEQTTGYPVTYSITTESFKLYRHTDLFKPLRTIPTHKFVLNYLGEQHEITSLSLIYNDDGTFSISGEFNFSDVVYSSSKYTTSYDNSLSLIDENGDFFVSDIQLFTYSVSSTSASVSFTSTTLTYSTYSESDYSHKEFLELPNLIPDSPAGVKYVTTSEGTNNFTITLNERKLY